MRMRRVDLLIALAILLLAGLVLDTWTAQPASRYLLTVAVVDRHEVELDEDAGYLGIDQAREDGHVYSDKAPYQPLLAAPFYLAYRWTGGDAFTWEPGEDHADAPFHWGRWWVTFWSATVPAIVLCLVVRRLVAQDHPEVAVPVALALSLGTVLLPFSGALFGHVMAAAFLVGAWALVRGEAQGNHRLFAAGLLIAGAVGSEFTAVIPVLVIVVAVLLARGIRPVITMGAGALLGAVPLFAYNTIAFGNPLETAYQGNLQNFQGSGAFGVYNLVAPQLEELRRALVGDRGLLTLTPICLLALAGGAIALLRRSPGRRDAIMGGVILVTMLLASAGIDGLGGASPGPRYLIPAIPFLAVPLAEVWRRVPLLCYAATAVGVVAMVAATMTAPLVRSGYTMSLSYWLHRVVDGRVTRSVPGELVGDWLLYVVVIAGILCGIAAVVFDQREQRAQTAAI